MSGFLPPVVMKILADGHQFITETGKVTAAMDAASASARINAEKQATAAREAAQAATTAAEQQALAAQTAAAKAEAAALKYAEAQQAATAAAEKAAAAQATAAAEGTEAAQIAADKAVLNAQRMAAAAEVSASRQAEAAARAASAVELAAVKQEAAAAAVIAADERAAAAAELTAKRTGGAHSKIMKGMAIAGGILATGLAVASVKGLESAAEYEKETTLLQTAGGELASNMGVVKDGILNIARATGTATDDLAKGMFTVEKAGFRGADGLNVLKVAAQGAKAENADMGTMTNALTSIMMSYHMKASEATSATNMLVAGAGAAKATMQTYAGSLSTVLPVASAAGISFKEVGGAIATLTQHGTSAEESTQELANTIRNLQAPNQVATKAMQQMGINVEDLTTKVGKRGLTGSIQLITDTIASKLGPSGTVLVDNMQKSATATQDLQVMLKQMPEDLAASAKAFLDGSLSQKAFSKEIKGMGANGAAQGSQFMTLAMRVKGYNAQIRAGGPAAQTAAAALKAVMGGATGMNTALMLSSVTAKGGGENMKMFRDKVKEVGDAGKKSGSDVATWAQTQQNLAVQMDKTKQSFETASIALGTALAPAAKTVMGAMQGMFEFFAKNQPAAIALGVILGVLTVGLLAAAAAMWVVNLAAMPMVLPIAGIVAGIAALIAIVILLVANWGSVVDFLKVVWGGFCNWVIQITDGFVSWWNQVWGGFGNWVGEVWGGFVNWVKEIWGGFVNWITGAVNGFVNGWNGMWADFGRAVSDAWNGLVTGATNGWNGLVGWITGAINGFLSWWNSTWSGLAQFFAPLFATIATIVTNGLNIVMTIIRAVTDTAGTIFRAGWDAVRAVFSAAWEAIQTVVATALSILIAVFTGHFDDIPRLVMEMFVKVAGFFSGAFDTIGQIVSGAWQTIVDIWTGAWNAIVGFGQAILSAYIGFIVGVFTGLLAWWNGMWANFGAFCITLWNNVVTFGRNAWNGFRTWIASLFVGLVAGAIATWNNFRSFLNGLWPAIVAFGTAAWNNFRAWLVGLFVGFVATAIGTWNGFMSFLNGLWNNIKNAATNAWNGLISWVQGIPDRITSALGNLGSLLTGAGNSIIDGFLKGLQAAYKGVQDFIGGIADWIAKHKGPISYDRTLLTPHGNAIMHGLHDGLRDKFSLVKGAVRDLTDMLTGDFADNLGIHSPSREFIKLAGYIGDGIRVGVHKSAPAAVKAMKSVAQKLTDTASAHWKKAAKLAPLKVTAPYTTKYRASDYMSTKTAADRARQAEARRKEDYRLAQLDAKTRAQVQAALAREHQRRNEVAEARALDSAAAAVRSQIARVEALAKQKAGLAAKLKDAQKRLDAAVKVRDKQAADTTKKLSGEFKLGDMVGFSAAEMVAGTKAVAARILAFGAKIKQLRALGVNAQLISEVAGLGSEDGATVADSLIAGGKGQIAQMNAAYSTVQSASKSAGNAVADGMYGAGVTGLQNLVKGYTGNIKAVDKAATDVANRLIGQTNKALGIKVKVPGLTAAQKAAAVKAAASKRAAAAKAAAARAAAAQKVAAAHKAAAIKAQAAKQAAAQAAAAKLAAAKKASVLTAAQKVAAVHARPVTPVAGASSNPLGLPFVAPASGTATTKAVTNNVTINAQNANAGQVADLITDQLNAMS